MNILTFDVEEWFHLLDHEVTRTEAQWANFESRIHRNMDRIHAALDARNQRATFFCVGWIARKYPEVIRQIHQLGHEVASHSDLHQLAFRQDRASFTADLERSIGELESLTGAKVRAYRAPGFSLKPENKWVFSVLAEHGIEVDCSVFPAPRAHGGFPDFGTAEPCWVRSDGVTLKEFPINLGSFLGKRVIFSGGGYFRLLPYPVLRRLFNRSPYVMTYFHPRDFDDSQPLVPGLGKRRRFKSYYGLSHTLPKLERLLVDQRFVDLATADSLVDWARAPVVTL